MLRLIDCYIDGGTFSCDKESGGYVTKCSILNFNMKLPSDFWININEGVLEINNDPKNIYICSKSKSFMFKIYDEENSLELTHESIKFEGSDIKALGKKFGIFLLKNLTHNNASSIIFVRDGSRLQISANEIISSEPISDELKTFLAHAQSIMKLDFLY